MSNQKLEHFENLLPNVHRYLGKESIVLETCVYKGVKEYHFSDCLDYQRSEILYLPLEEVLEGKLDSNCFEDIEIHLIKDYREAKAKPGGLDANYLTSITSVAKLSNFLKNFRRLEEVLNDPKLSLEEEIRKLDLTIFSPGEDEKYLNREAIKSLVALIDENAKMKVLDLAKETGLNIFESKKNHFDTFSPSRRQAALDLFDQELKAWEEGQEEYCLVRTSLTNPGPLRDLVSELEGLPWGQIKRLPSWLASFIAIDADNRVSLEEATPEIMKIVGDINSSAIFEDKTLRELIQMAQAL